MTLETHNIVVANIYRSFIRRLSNITFDILQGLGFHLVPNSYSHPIPDTRLLGDELWERQSSLQGIDMNDAAQLALLETFKNLYKAEYGDFPAHPTQCRYDYYAENNLFGSVEAALLHGMVRHFKPAKIIEVGSGFSTRVSAAAALMNVKEGHPCELVAVEPFPGELLSEGFPGLTELLPYPVQRVPAERFQALESGDILFVDSSHSLSIGSDLYYLFLEVIPSLNPGVVIHWHDIFLPAQYPRKWIMKKHMFPNEQYFLQAFLAFNSEFEVLLAGNYLDLKYPQALDAAMPGYLRPGGLGSFWMRRIENGWMTA